MTPEEILQTVLSRGVDPRTLLLDEERIKFVIATATAIAAARAESRAAVETLRGALERYIKSDFRRDNVQVLFDALEATAPPATSPEEAAGLTDVVQGTDKLPQTPSRSESRRLEVQRPPSPSPPCVTHHYACDCREAEFAALRGEAGGGGAGVHRGVGACALSGRRHARAIGSDVARLPGEWRDAMRTPVSEEAVQKAWRRLALAGRRGITTEMDSRELAEAALDWAAKVTSVLIDFELVPGSVARASPGGPKGDE